MDSLGKTLKEARIRNNQKLREIEEKTGISNAYLSQIENDKIKKPSANVLYKIATAYGVELDDLLFAAGIIERKERRSNDQLSNKIAFYADDLTEDENEEVIKFIKYLKFKKDND